MKLTQKQIEEIFAHARQELPYECCGLFGGRDNHVSSVYKFKNVAVNPLVEYEAAPEELFRAQKLMRERGERLIGIYHSHPRAAEPFPSQTDIERAFYPEAIYFIVGFAQNTPVLRAFRIFEYEPRWMPAGFEIAEP
ncbi:MAG: M67 family metallopeptidase [Acidobacteriota bacterium]|nr:M67 family metallopeptidase [Acidobacteriota bacterium]